jgi:hypothetical protein
MTTTFTGLLLAGILAIAPQATAAPAPTPVPGACRGLSDSDRYVWLLTDRHNIVAVNEIRPEEFMSDSFASDPRAGARVVIAAGPWLTAEWLERIGECHIAQNAAQGHLQRASPSPLDVEGAEVRVSSVGNGFAVDITSYDWKAGREILKRARALLSPPASS